MKMRSTLNVPKCITKGVLAIICSNSFSHCKGDQKKTVAISQMFNHVQLHIHWMHLLSTCPAKNQAGCIERVVHHSHENQKFYLLKIAINEKCQKPKLTVKVIMVAMATAV